MSTAKRWTARVATTGLALLSLASSLSAQVPNARLEVTYRQLQEGKLSKSVHYLILDCWNGECALTTLTLNQCVDFGWGPPRFFPKIERTTTEERTATGQRTLMVSRTGPNTIIAEETHPETFLRYRFTFVKPKPEPGSIFDGFVINLTEFSGAAAKDSEILDKAIGWELVPLKSEIGVSAVAFAFVKLECLVQLPAVLSTKP